MAPARLIAALLGGLALAIAAARQPAARGGPDDLTDFLEKRRADNDLPALGAIVFRTNETLAQGAVGVRVRGSPEAVTLDDRFHLGSCTKAMTATLIARLVEQRRLKWTDTIGETFKAERDKFLPAYYPVTLEQLLMHRSGLPEDRQAGPLLLRLRNLSGTPPEQRAAAIPHILSIAPVAKPGAKMVYSNAGYLVAAALAERATGRSWEDLIGEYVFKPLRITTAGVGPPGSADKIDQPRGHGGAFGAGTPAPPDSPFADNPVSMFPAGGAHMSLRDWARFGADQLAEGRGGHALLKPGSYVRLHTPPPGGDYAQGWGVATDPKLGRILSHAGSNTLWFAVIRLAPERGIGVVIATNSASPEAQRALPDAAESLLSRYAGTPATQRSPP